MDSEERIHATELLRQHLEEHGVETLDMLTPREKKVISLRLGLTDGRIRSREEVGKAFNVTPERIRLIESKVLRSFRMIVRRRRLRDFLS